MYKLLPELQSFWRENNITTDHLDGYIFNNCIYNLSEMSGSTNASKSDLQKYIKDTLGLLMCYDGIGYRTQFAYVSSADRIRTLYFYCDTPEELTKMIRWRVENRWLSVNKREGELYTGDMYSIFFHERRNLGLLHPTYDCATMQRKLAELPLETFRKWSE